MTAHNRPYRSPNLMLLVVIGAGLFAVLGAMNLGLPLLYATPFAAQPFSDWTLGLAEAATESLLLLALVQVSLVLGWRETRFFWLVSIALLLVCHLAMLSESL